MKIFSSCAAVLFAILASVWIEASPGEAVRVEGDRVVLGASSAQPSGKIRFEGDPVSALVSWNDRKDRIAFRIECAEACRYDLSIAYACDPQSEGSSIEVACGESRLKAKTFATGGWTKFAALPLGPIDLPKGASEIAVRALSAPEGAQGILSLRSLILEKGFSDIFDGKSLKGWWGSTDGYAVKEGYIYCIKEKGGNLLTEKEYSDFALRFEFRLYPGANNGLGLRTPSPKVDAAYEGMEIQILDDRHPMYKDIQPWQAHGSIYNLFPAERDRLRKCGEWNVEEVICDGRRVSVTLNGTTIVDANLDDVKDPEVLKKHPGIARKSGFIGFLGHGSEVDFRNIRVKELAPQSRK